MKFISETIIEQVITNLAETPDGYDQAIEDFQKSQPVIMAYLFSESFRMLSQEEREFMLYLAIVVWKSVNEATEELPGVKAAALEVAEDRNWEAFQNASGRTFRDKLDVFFDNYLQEDLLAFVEDSLEEDDEHPLSKPGREVIFVSLKSIIDSLLEGRTEDFRS